MNWEKLELHIENLIPGIVLLSIAVFALAADKNPMSGHEATLAIAFVATAYMLGVVGNVLARLLLDPICRETVRSPIFRCVLAGKIGSDLTARGIDKRYSEVINAGLTCGNARVETEVAKRRQTGRLLRSTLLPVWMTMIVFGLKGGGGLILISFSMLVSYCVLLILYSYAEAMIYQEAFRGEEIKKEAALKADGKGEVVKPERHDT